jgi:hypothetical protein
LVFVLVRSLGLFQVVVVLVVGLESLQVVSLLGVLPIVLNTGMGGVVALRWRGGMVHDFPFVVLVLLQVVRVGSLIVVTMVVFVEVALVGDVLDRANPTFEQMARHWFYSFGTNPSAESFVRSRVKDRYGEPERGGSEWEPIKILLEGDGNSYRMNTASNTRLRLTTQVGQAHVATGVPLNLGTTNTPFRPENAAEHQTSSPLTNTS